MGIKEIEPEIIRTFMDKIYVDPSKKVKETNRLD